MALFDTKQNLNNGRFEQASGDTLTLGGITNVTGDLQIDGVSIRDLTGSTSGGTGNDMYTLGSPAAISLGGITAGYIMTGKTYGQILEKLLVPTLNPTLTAPSSTFTDNVAATFEVGSSQNITFTATFSRGSISPAYGTSGFRSGLPTKYVYTGSGIAGQVSSSSLSNNRSLTGYTILAGSNTWTASVAYSVGEQPKDSSGANYSTPLASGATSPQSNTITGIYPYFYGKSSTLPTANNALVTGGTKVVASSSGSINISFNASSEYLWFAHPSSVTTKTAWSISALNNGAIGSGSDLFNAPSTVSVTTVLWSGVNYKVYLSNYATSTGSDVMTIS
ncbi:hypothetical protein WBG78_28400 [Chryseolinea sp. T2]|uniref:hypothetical protein n=1 Tax=Chryseolinea sp. T2 TaxID=3129255 RepID=UPI0030777776